MDGMPSTGCPQVHSSFSSSSSSLTPPLLRCLRFPLNWHQAIWRAVGAQQSNGAAAAAAAHWGTWGRARSPRDLQPLGASSQCRVCASEAVRVCPLLSPTSPQITSKTQPSFPPPLLLFTGLLHFGTHVSPPPPRAFSLSFFLSLSSSGCLGSSGRVELGTRGRNWPHNKTKRKSKRSED